MSSPSLPVALAQAARDDLRDIELYTFAAWGERQWQAYEARLWQALESLGDNPGRGRTRDELVPGYRSLVVDQHVIFYQRLPTAIVVIRILHGHADARRALRERP